MHPAPPAGRGLASLTDALSAGRSTEPQGDRLLLGLWGRIPSSARRGCVTQVLPAVWIPEVEKFLRNNPLLRCQVKPGCFPPEGNRQTALRPSVRKSQARHSDGPTARSAPWVGKAETGPGLRARPWGKRPLGYTSVTQLTLPAATHVLRRPFC